jgi:hypothetical protein
VAAAREGQTPIRRLERPYDPARRSGRATHGADQSLFGNHAVAMRVMRHMRGVRIFCAARRRDGARLACRRTAAGGVRLGWSAPHEEYRMNGIMDVSATENRAQEVEITSKRIEELIRWHGTDESTLPPAHTLQNLSRDTVAALRELAGEREMIARLRAAMAQAFWATDRRELNAILLEALAPPPGEPLGASASVTPESDDSVTSEASSDQAEQDAPMRLDARVGRALHHPGAARPLNPRTS